MRVDLNDAILGSTMEPLERLVLLAVASHINRDGTQAWPSLERLAELTGLSRATVQRHMCALKNKGVVTVRRRFSASSVYSIASIPQKSQSATSGAEQSLQADTSVPAIPPEVAECDLQKSQPATLTVQGTVQENLPLFQPMVEDDGFDEFWSAYGKKVGKREAQTKWRSMAQRDREAAMAGLPSYLEANRNPKYRKDPIRYLRHERWQDERGSAKNTGPKHYAPEEEGERLYQEFAHKLKGSNATEKRSAFREAAREYEFEPLRKFISSMSTAIWPNQLMAMLAGGSSEQQCPHPEGSPLWMDWHVAKAGRL